MRYFIGSNLLAGNVTCWIKVKWWRQQAPQKAEKCLNIYLSGAINRHLITNPILAQRTRWVESGSEMLNYLLSQILTGHNWFEKYLHRIVSELSPLCMECGALYTLIDASHLMLNGANRRMPWSGLCHCPQCLLPLRVFVKKLAVIKFSEYVMVIKEGGESIRERLNAAGRERRRRRLCSKCRWFRVDPG